MPRAKQPNLVAAMTACVDLVEACNPDHSAGKRRKLMFRAIGSAIEATGASNEKRQHANATLHLFEEETVPSGAPRPLNAKTVEMIASLSARNGRKN